MMNQYGSFNSQYGAHAAFDHPVYGATAASAGLTAAGTAAVASKSLLAAAAGTAVAAPPFSTIIAAIPAAAGAGFAAATAVRNRREKLLSGDASAIARYVKRANRWSDKKLQRRAARDFNSYRKHLAKKNKKRFLSRKVNAERRGWQVEEARRRLKLAALVGIAADREINLRGRGKKVFLRQQRGSRRDFSRLTDRQVQPMIDTPPTTATDTSFVSYLPVALVGVAVVAGGIFLMRRQTTKKKG
jgi:hypothetical protein